MPNYLWEIRGFYLPFNKKVTHQKYGQNECRGDSSERKTDIVFNIRTPRKEAKLTDNSFQGSGKICDNSPLATDN